jgi:phi13 family phage major tail protein
MRHPVWAPLQSHTDGSEPTYGAGRVIQEAIEATITYNADTTNGLYGDDVLVDMDDGITGYTVSFNPTGLKDADRAAILGEEVTTGSVYEITDAGSPWGGFGYFRVMRDQNRTRYYEAWWCRKIKFREPSQTTRTKEGSVQWRTPTLEGTGAGLIVDGGEKIKYIKHKTFETAAAAKAWLDGLANVSAVTT